MDELSDAVEGIIAAQRDVLFEGFNVAERSEATESVRLWVSAWLESHRKPKEEFDRFVNETIPQHLQDELDGLNKKDRYAFAATSFDRWRLQLLNKQVLDRAKAFQGNNDKRDEQKNMAIQDLDELKKIEARLTKNFPDIQHAYKTIISESKLDCLFLLRDGAISSLRMAKLAPMPDATPKRKTGQND